jgi:hypothetical protein
MDDPASEAVRRDDPVTVVPEMQSTVLEVGDILVRTHVWPLLSLWQLKPVGQQPMAVSGTFIRNCTTQPDSPPAVAEHAGVWPAGQITPGE